MWFLRKYISLLLPCQIQKNLKKYILLISSFWISEKWSSPKKYPAHFFILLEWCIEMFTVCLQLPPSSCNAKPSILYYTSLQQKVQDLQQSKSDLCNVLRELRSPWPVSLQCRILSTTSMQMSEKRTSDTGSSVNVSCFRLLFIWTWINNRKFVSLTEYCNYLLTFNLYRAHWFTSMVINILGFVTCSEGIWHSPKQTSCSS